MEGEDVGGYSQTLRVLNEKVALLNELLRDGEKEVGAGLPSFEINRKLNMLVVGVTGLINHVREEMDNLDQLHFIVPQTNEKKKIVYGGFRKDLNKPFSRTAGKKRTQSDIIGTHSLLTTFVMNEDLWGRQSKKQKSLTREAQELLTNAKEMKVFGGGTLEDEFNIPPIKSDKSDSWEDEENEEEENDKGNEKSYGKGQGAVLNEHEEDSDSFEEDLFACSVLDPAGNAKNVTSVIQKETVLPPANASQVEKTGLAPVPLHSDDFDDERSDNFDEEEDNFDEVDIIGTQSGNPAKDAQIITPPNPSSKDHFEEIEDDFSDKEDDGPKEPIQGGLHEDTKDIKPSNINSGGDHFEEKDDDFSDNDDDHQKNTNSGQVDITPITPSIPSNPSTKDHLEEVDDDFSDKEDEVKKDIKEEPEKISTDNKQNQLSDAQHFEEVDNDFSDKEDNEIKTKADNQSDAQIDKQIDKITPGHFEEVDDDFDNEIEDKDIKPLQNKKPINPTHFEEVDNEFESDKEEVEKKVEKSGNNTDEIKNVNPLVNEVEDDFSDEEDENKKDTQEKDPIIDQKESQPDTTKNIGENLTPTSQPNTHSDDHIDKSDSWEEQEAIPELTHQHKSTKAKLNSSRSINKVYRIKDLPPLTTNLDEEQPVGAKTDRPGRLLTEEPEKIRSRSKSPHKKKNDPHKVKKLWNRFNNIESFRSWKSELAGSKWKPAGGKIEKHKSEKLKWEPKRHFSMEVNMTELVEKPKKIASENEHSGSWSEDVESPQRNSRKGARDGGMPLQTKSQSRKSEKLKDSQKGHKREKSGEKASLQGKIRSIVHNDKPKKININQEKKPKDSPAIGKGSAKDEDFEHSHSFSESEEEKKPKSNRKIEPPNETAKKSFLHPKQGKKIKHKTNEDLKDSPHNSQSDEEDWGSAEDDASAKKNDEEVPPNIPDFKSKALERFHSKQSKSKDSLFSLWPSVTNKEKSEHSDSFSESPAKSPVKPSEPPLQFNGLSELLDKWNQQKTKSEEGSKNDEELSDSFESETETAVEVPQVIPKKEIVCGYGIAEDMNKQGLIKSKKLDVSQTGKKKVYLMEDTNVCLYPLDSQEIALFCVFDGHAGKRCSTDLISLFPATFKKHWPSNSSKASMTKFWTQVYSEVDSKLTKYECEGSTGTTVSVWRATDGRTLLQAANVGDSSAFLLRGNRAVPISEDHKPTNPGERRRLQEAGFISQGQTRLSVGLAVSRAFGDFFPKSVSGVLSEPYMSEIYEIGSEDTKVIVASDGLWDIVSGQTAFEIIKSFTDPQLAAKKLLQTAVQSPKCTDNVTVIVVHLQ